MQDYCTSSTLSRRQFLKGLLAWSGLLIASQAEAIKTKSKAPHPASHLLSWHEPVWVLSLADNRYYFPTKRTIPHALPGSLMKLIAATALLEEKLLSPEQTMECRGTISLNGQSFHCQHPHGKRTLEEAIGLSCNVFFVQAAQMLSIRRFLQYAQLYRLHEPALAGDAFLFPAEFANGHPAQAYALGLSRNMQPNALQLTRMAALIAHRKIPGLHASTWKILQGGMRMAVTRGTAAELDPKNRLHIAAKTGTTLHGNTFQSWLIGYFPLENPAYAFCARSTTGTAKESAVPLASRFLRAQEWGKI